MKKILCICFSPTYQRTVWFKDFTLEMVNRSTGYNIYASGKAVNSARILAQLDKACVTTFCPLGMENAQEFIKLAEKDNLNLVYAKLPGKIRECWTLLNQKNASTTELVVGEPLLSVNKAFLKQQEKILTKQLPALINKADGIILAGSKPAMWDSRLYAKICKCCCDSNKFLLADFTGPDLLETLKLCTPSVIKINDMEFRQTFNLNSQVPEEELKKAVTETSRRLNNMIVVTRGTDSTFAANKGSFMEEAVRKIVPVNTTACGDSFNAGFIYEYLNTEDFKKAVEKGGWAATQNALAEAPGTIYPDN